MEEQLFNDIDSTTTTTLRCFILIKDKKNTLPFRLVISTNIMLKKLECVWCAHFGVPRVVITYYLLIPVTIINYQHHTQKRRS